VLGVVNWFPRWQHHRTKYHKLRCKIGICKPFHQILCIRNVLNNKLLRSQYNEIVQWKSVTVWVRFAGIWDKIKHLYYSHAEVHIMIVPWHILVNDIDLSCSPKLPKKKWHSRSSKVIEFGANRKPLYDFLLVINSNLGLISHRYWDTASYWPKIANFAHPLSFSALVRGDSLRIYGKALRFLKLESSGQPTVKN